MKAYSVDLRQRIVAAVTRGTKLREVVAHFQVSEATVRRYVRQQAATGSLTPKHAPGRPRRIAPQHYAALRAQIDATPDATLAEQCQTWQRTHGITLSPSTLCRLLAHLEYSQKKDNRGDRTG